MKKKFYQITNKSFDELKVKTHEELWKKIKKDHQGFCACVTTVFTKAEDSENKFKVVMSTPTEDRHGDIVMQNWVLKYFSKNPVFIDSHNYDSIEHILGKVNKPKVKDNNLVGEIEFALDNPKGLLAFKLVVGGFLNAVSVGFIPLEFDNDGKILKSELLELSAVSVPAQAEALFEKKIKKVKKIEDKKIEIIEETKKNLRLDALKRIVEKKEFKRKEILKEVLAVTQQLSKGGVDAEKRRQMANRAIKQLIKVKQ